MMADLQANHHIIISISRRFFSQPRIHSLPISTVPPKPRWPRNHRSFKLLASSVSDGGSALVQQHPPSKDGDLGSMIDQMVEVGPGTGGDGGDEGKEEIVDGYLVREYGWKVRRMVEENSEMKRVAEIQAHAFHVPAFFFDDFFFHFFQADVLSGLYYRLRNSPPDRYACLVAEPAKEGDAPLTKHQQRRQQLVGVVDVTVLRDNDVLRHLQGADEYLYVSGIAVAHNFRIRCQKSAHVNDRWWLQESPEFHTQNPIHTDGQELCKENSRIFESNFSSVFFCLNTKSYL